MAGHIARQKLPFAYNFSIVWRNCVKELAGHASDWGGNRGAKGL